MEQFNKILSGYRTVNVAVVSIITMFIQEGLKSLSPQVSMVERLALTIVFIVFIVKVIEKIGLFAIDNVKAFRKLIFGRAYVEGLWIDITFDKTKKEVLFGALSDFSYKNGRILSEANSFNYKGNIIGNYNLRANEYSEHCLKYGFEGNFFGAKKGPKIWGYGEALFGVREGSPIQYSGFFIDTSHQKLLNFEGEIIKDKNLIRELKQNTKNRCNILAKYLSDFANRRGYDICKEEKQG